MNCKICPSDNTTRIHHDAPGGPWWHCLDCGSSSSEEVYNPSLYTEYLDFYRDRVGSFEHSKREQTNNVALFQKHRSGCPDNTFLDIGHCDGAGMSAMQDAGWAVHGFDVAECCQFENCTTIASEFKASLFPRQYSAIQCREVIEHVPDWKALLDEIYKACMIGGMVAIQTPRPWHEIIPDHSTCYIRGHLQIFSVPSLKWAIIAAGFDLIDSMTWDAGQLVMGRKRR